MGNFASILLLLVSMAGTSKDQIYFNTATAANSLKYSIYIDQPLLYGHFNAVFIALKKEPNT